jgi:hypothetical protein
MKTLHAVIAKELGAEQLKLQKQVRARALEDDLTSLRYEKMTSQ